MLDRQFLQGETVFVLPFGLLHGGDFSVEYLLDRLLPVQNVLEGADEVDEF